MKCTLLLLTDQAALVSPNQCTHTLQLHELDPNLGNRMRDYVTAKWSIDKGVNIDSVLMELPDHLRGDVMMALHGQVVEHIPFFRNTDKSFRRALVVKLKPEVCLAGDYVYREGWLGTKMYFVHEGAMRVWRHGRVTRLWWTMLTQLDTRG